VRTDGLHFEQSIYYHVYALDLFLHARICAAQAGKGHANVEPAGPPAVGAAQAGTARADAEHTSALDASAAHAGAPNLSTANADEPNVNAAHAGTVYAGAADAGAAQASAPDASTAHAGAAHGAPAAGSPVPSDLDPAIRRMLAALETLSQGRALPRFGDDDGGRLFDPSRNRAEHMLDPLSTGAALFGDAGFKAASPGLIEETLWLLGPAGAAAFDAIPAAARPACRARPGALAASGIYAMTSLGPPVAQLFIDAGEQGAQGAGHGHADALSVQLAAGGRMWLTDPGTCAYVGDDAAREAFRGTRAHNTMTVDGRDQADPQGPFSWGPRPLVEVLRWDPQEGHEVFEGRHSGYARLAEPVTHRRWVLRFGAGLWLVRDAAEGRGAHELEIAWHFAPETTATCRGEAVAACCGAETLTIVPAMIVPAADAAWERTLEMAECSPAYGLRVPAAVVRWKTRAALPAEFAVVLGFGIDAARARLERRSGAEAGSVEYEYSPGDAGDARCGFHFSSSGVRWGE
jgi:hypothetical protein